MIRLRVTKYDPGKRDRRGRYLGNDYTSPSDVGSVIGGTVVRAIDYVLVEDAYVQSVGALLSSVGGAVLHVSELEDWRGSVLVDREVRRLRPASLDSLREGMAVGGDDIERVVRMNLRDEIWCKPSGPSGVYVHFGHDLYMYMGCDGEDVALGPPPKGVFHEDSESPYA